MTIARTPEGAVKAGTPITITCTRDAAKPAPQLTLMKNGDITDQSFTDSVTYVDTNTDKSNNLMNYTCEATGGDIDDLMRASLPPVTLICMRHLSYYNISYYHCISVILCVNSVYIFQQVCLMF